MPWKQIHFACAALAGMLVVAASAAMADDKANPDDEVLALGRAVFLNTAEPSCGICHWLADAGTAGEIGPNLDDLKPSEAQVRNAVMGGVGIMPAFEDRLSPVEIDAVARYVAAMSRKAN